MRTLSSAPLWTSELIVNDVTPTTIRLAPPLIVSDAEAEEGVTRLRSALGRAS